MTRTRRRGLLTALLLVVALIAAGCGDDDDGPDQGGAADDEPVRGGSLTFMYNIDVAGSFDPALAQIPPQMRAIYGWLVRTDVQDPTKTTPDLAESITSDDAKVWDVNLRPGVKFSDGTALDADAVIFNLKRIQEPGGRSSFVPILAQVDHYDKVDNETVRFTLKQASATFGSSIGNLALASPTAFQALGAQGFATKPVGAGPFVLKEFVQGSHTALTRNPTYWDPDRPYLDELTIRVVLDPEQRYNALIAGDADVGSFIENPELYIRGESAGVSIVHVRNAVLGRYMIFNTTKAPFDDVRARRAIALAFDQEGYIDALAPGATEKHSIIQSFSPFYDEDTEFPGYDADAAQELFDELADDGKPLEFTFQGVPVYVPFMEWFQASLTKFDNVKMNIEPIQVNTVSQRALEKNFTLLGFGGGGSEPDLALYDRFLSTSPTNFAGFKSTEIDRALAAGRQSTDLDERVEAYTTVQEVLTENVVVLPFPESPLGVMANDDVGGIEDAVVEPVGAPSIDFAAVWKK